MNLKNRKIDKSWTLFLDRDGVINKKKENDLILPVLTGKHFKFFREAYQMSQREIAEKAGKHPQSIYNLEQNCWYKPIKNKYVHILKEECVPMDIWETTLLQCKAAFPEDNFEIRKVV